MKKRLKKARFLRREKRQEYEDRHVGELRVGNSGVMSPKGEVAGKCHRQTHLRQLDLEIEELEYSKLIMFERGFNNEDIIYEDLLSTLEEGEAILREEEIPTSWFTSNGTRVTGRPDAVLCTKSSAGIVPKLVLEFKSLASVNPAIQIAIDEEPVFEHLCQLAHYMWQCGSLPGSLIYRQYSNLIIPNWPFILAKLPKEEGAPGGEYIKWNKIGKPQEIKPFEKLFDVSIDNNRVAYRVSSEDETAVQKPWVQTMITIDGIVQYYEFVSQMEKEKKLGPRPLTISVTGKDKSYSICNYCPVKFACDKYESKGYDEWRNAVTDYSNKLVDKHKIENK